jgi:hypothetical protein
MTQHCDGERAWTGLVALLDDLRARGTVPAGTRGRIYAMLDDLRAASAPAHRIQAAERIALTIHRLEWARLQKAGEQEEALWRRLHELAAELTNATGESAVLHIEY